VGLFGFVSSEATCQAKQNKEFFSKVCEDPKSKEKEGTTNTGECRRRRAIRPSGLS
jgi:hypothetical protein